MQLKDASLFRQQAYIDGSWLAADPEEALIGVRQLVGEVMADMKANAEPEPSWQC